MVSLSPPAVHFLWVHAVHLVGNPNRLVSPFGTQAPFSTTTSIAMGPLTATALAAGAVAAKPPPSSSSSSSATASKQPGTDAAGSGGGMLAAVGNGGALAPPQVHRAAVVALAHLCTMMLGDADALGFHPSATATSASASPKAAKDGKSSKRRNGIISGSVSALASYDEKDEEGNDENDGDEEAESSATATSAAAAAAALTYVVPHVNTVLRLVGGWLFDAALNPGELLQRETTEKLSMVLGRHSYCIRAASILAVSLGSCMYECTLHFCSRYSCKPFILMGCAVCLIGLPHSAFVSRAL